MATHPFADTDARLVSVAKGINVLQAIAWPERLCASFLEGWRKGAPLLPEPPPVPAAPALDSTAAELEALLRPHSTHPGARFVADTAASYLATVRMLQAAGTAEFTRLSLEIYGQPSDAIAPGGVSNLAAADHFLETTQALQESCFVTDADLCLTPEHVRDVLQQRSRQAFGDQSPTVELDPTMASKAAAGAERIRIRSATCFTPADLEQLWFHEACVHSGTAINGRLQPQLTALSLGAPRTTATQEGLATFSELITGAIDLARLRRLALRVRAIHMGLAGADFIQVFRFFHDAGQGERESFSSAARIFRGGDPRGGVVFTKDGVYLKGLLQVYCFLHAALADNRVDRARQLFAGRLTCEDVLALDPLFADGTVSEPRHEPTWLQQRGQLGAYLSFSALAHSLPFATGD